MGAKHTWDPRPSAPVTEALNEGLPSRRDLLHDGSVPLTPYQRRLPFFLSVATFFEGFDIFAIAQLLPSLRRDMGLTEADGGAMVSIIASGSILAYFLIRKADHWGRRRVLTLTIAGYTLCTL